jgi:hypothetical protein
MRLACALLVVVAGCQTTDHPDYPVNPGGGIGVGSGGHKDAGVGDGGGDGGAKLVGRVCVLGDLRRLDTCPTAGAGGLTVTLGTKVAITAADGTFAIDVPGGVDLFWRVSGGSVVPMLTPFSASTTLFTVDSTTYNELLVANGVLIADGEGSIAVHVVRNNFNVAGATAIVNPPSPNPTFYDGNSLLTWDQDATGTFGVVWLPGPEVGLATVAVKPPAPFTPVQTTVPVENLAITIVTLEIP